MKLIDRIGSYSYYELTDEEVFIYGYMEILKYPNGIEADTKLNENILSIKGNIILVRCVVRYFEELSESSHYKVWLRKYKLNNICLKLVK